MRLGQQKNGAPGKGVERNGYVQAVIRVDPEMNEEIRAKALRDGTSLAEALRTLIEWGLQAEREPEAPGRTTAAGRRLRAQIAESKAAIAAYPPDAQRRMAGKLRVK